VSAPGEAPDQVAFDVDPAAGAAREERCRLATLAASGPLILLLSPLVLPFAGDRSLLHDTRHDTSARLILIAVYVWPLLVGVVGLRGALARRAPPTFAFAAPAVVHALAAGATLLSVIASMTKAYTSGEPLAWALLGLSATALYLLLRGFRRRGFHRWAQLVAGVWIGHAAFALMMVVDGGLAAAPALGTWLLLFAAAAAAPGVAWALVPARR